MRRVYILFIPVFLFFAGCSLDYKSAFESEKLAEKIPETILINFKHIVVDDNKKVFQIEAERAMIFKKNKLTSLTNVHFYEYDYEGNIVTEGWADNARFFRDTENAEIWGDVYFYSAKEGAEIYTPSLTWEKETKILQSKPEELVRINKDDGSFIQGRGFMADLRRKSVSFLSNVWGKIVREDEEE
jgi:LPS export ABC transporter protein LptC